MRARARVRLCRMSASMEKKICPAVLKRKDAGGRRALFTHCHIMEIAKGGVAAESGVSVATSVSSGFTWDPHV
jgi:hypothetical protein